VRGRYFLQFAHRSPCLVDGDLRHGVGAGVGVGEGNAPERFSRDLVRRLPRWPLEIVFLSEVLAGVEILVLQRQFVRYLERTGV